MLKRTSLTTPSVLLTVFTLAASPSFGQEHSHGRQNTSGRSSGQAVERGTRSEGPRQQGAAPQTETRQQTPRAQANQRVETPRAQTYQRADTPRRDSSYGGPRRDVIAPRGNVYAPRYSPRYSTGGYAPRAYYRPYAFRPHFSIGFGIYAGYPVPYTYSYPYPVGVYGYGAPRSDVMIGPNPTAYGGVALEITPYDADVYVDGQYAGHAQDFDGTTQPLTLTVGTHRIEVQAPGYRPMTVDVGIQPGQVIPYRGELAPY